MLPPKLINTIYYHWRRSNWFVDPKFYFGNYEDITIEKPIFLIGNQGDGLTLVSRIFRRHSNVVSPTGNHNYWSGADEIQIIFGLALPIELTGTKYKAPKHSILTPPRSWSYAADELLPVYRKTDEDATPELAERFKKVIRYVLAKYSPHDINQPARFIDKSQVYTVRVSLINELLKEHNPKFVLITRNPFASCYRAAIGRAGDMERYKKSLSFEERLKLCAQHWSNSMRCVLEDREKMDNDILITQFEEILKYPHECMRKICEFVELEFNEDMLPQPYHKIPLGSKYEDRWYPLRPDVNEVYLDKLSKEDIKIIENRCGGLALKLGYYPPS